jgi:hypothetical protein
MRQLTWQETRTFGVKKGHDKAQFPGTRPIYPPRYITHQVHSANRFQSDTPTLNYEIFQSLPLTVSIHYPLH